MEDKQIVTLVDEEGKKVDCEVVEILEIEDDKYALLAPIEEGEEEEDAYVYKIVEVDGKVEYVPIEDDDEFERVLEEYESQFDAE